MNNFNHFCPRHGDARVEGCSMCVWATRDNLKLAKIVHELKTWPEYYDAVRDGTKTFEIRKDDRGFAVDDVLHLRRYNPVNDTYTGEESWWLVTYLTNWEQKPGHVVMAIREL